LAEGSWILLSEDRFCLAIILHRLWKQVNSHLQTNTPLFRSQASQREY